MAIFARRILLIATLYIFMSCIAIQCSLCSAQPIDFNTMVKHAESGDAKAQFFVGLSYFIGEYRDGTHIGLDYAKAFSWFSKSAEAGDSNAQWYLGGMYHEGKGVEEDINKAAQWFLLAAKSGNVQARTNIAGFYFYGTGVKKDFDKAYAWASLASFSGNINAGNLVQMVLPLLEDRSRADLLAGEYAKAFGITRPEE